MAKKKTTAKKAAAKPPKAEKVASAGKVHGVIKCRYDEIVALVDLKPNKKNPNKHSVGQLKTYGKIMRANGVREPVRVSERSGLVVKGHGQMLAAAREGWTHVPVEYQDYASDALEIADLIADNALNQQSSLDMDMVNLEVPNLGASFDFDILGIADFSGGSSDSRGSEKEDDVPEPPKKAKSKRGDLFVLGNHRLMCGDSTVEVDVNALMNGDAADLMVTDPPYGVKLDQSWRDGALGSKALGRGNSATILGDDRSDWSAAWIHAPAPVAYVWHASSFTDIVMASLRSAGFDVRQQIIWNKTVMVMGRGAYHFKHEPCWFAVRSGSSARWMGDRKQTTVWDAAAPNHIMSGSKEIKTEHPTQKPVSLYEIPIQNHTARMGGLYDPFGGSGTGIIACEKLDRRCFTMELAPAYCDVILDRWAAFTGKDPVRSDGKPWSVIRRGKRA